jgi:pimeloyl-ACP methyl ester carboxylesterase
MRACEPDRSGTVERDGVRVGYDVYGEGLGQRGATLLLLTSWAIVHARQWKAQVPYLSRHFQVVTVEGRGNGRADRPGTQEAYADREYVDDVVTVLDALGIERAVVGGLSMGGRHALQLAAWYPERAAGVIAIGPAFPWPTAPEAVASGRSTSARRSGSGTCGAILQSPMSCEPRVQDWRSTG